MIEYRKTGNIFEAGTHAIVNPINCVGTMGKGLAAAFKSRYPQMNRFYKEACDAGEVVVGRMWMWRERRLEDIVLPDGRVILEPEWIINFPTKDHWKNPSKLEWIRAGLDDLRSHVILKRIESVALPALGCGNGGLDFGVVRTAIEEKLGELPLVVVYEPQ